MEWWNGKWTGTVILRTGWGLGTPRDPPDRVGACVWGDTKGSSGQGGGLWGDTKGGSRDVPGILWTGWRPVSEGTPREDPGMSLGYSGQGRGLCVKGHQGRIPGCPRDPPDWVGDPPDRVGACVWGDTKGSFRTGWGPVCVGTPREDPGMSKGSSGQGGGLCVRGHQGRIPGCPRDPPDREGACVWGDTNGGSQDVQGILQTVWTPVGNTGHPSKLDTHIKSKFLASWDYKWCGRQKLVLDLRSCCFDPCLCTSILDHF